MDGRLRFRDHRHTFIPPRLAAIGHDVCPKRKEQLRQPFADGAKTEDQNRFAPKRPAGLREVHSTPECHWPSWS